MADVRMRYNFDFIRGLARSHQALSVVVNTGRKIDQAVQAQGGKTKFDFQGGDQRARAAVIAGYEDGATAESTRRMLLRALDAGIIADG